MSESLPLSLDSFRLCRLFDPGVPVPSNACLIGLKWRQSDRSETYLIPTEHSLRQPQTGPSWWPVITDALLCNHSLISTREALQGHLNIPNKTPPPLSTPAAFNSSSPNSPPPLYLGASQPPCLVFKWRCLGVSKWCVWEGTCCSHRVWGARVRATALCVSVNSIHLSLWSWRGRATIVMHTAPDATKIFDCCICLQA